MNVGVTMRRILSVLRRACFRLVVPSIIALNILALVGFFVRDRSRWLALLLYLPLVPAGLFAVILSGGFRESRSRHTRAFLLALGLVSTSVGGYWMIGWSVAPPTRPEDWQLRLLHWNVWWGGVAIESRTPWDRIGQEIIDKKPDLIVLSEAPFTQPLYRKLDELPGPHFGLSVLSYGKGKYFFHMFVGARWPIRLERLVTIADGGAAVVRLAHPARPVRILLVDGASTITRSRTPMLRDLAATCTRAADEGTPIDIIVGDFNAVSRSIGFDELSRCGGGYQLASRFCRAWRATWPSFIPLLDIDHVWARTGWIILGSRLFTNLASDHRGQLVTLAVPEGN
jgi:endonuclease/exonuclease/phosphatase family metal-dependent hydrolase